LVDALGQAFFRWFLKKVLMGPANVRQMQGFDHAGAHLGMTNAIVSLFCQPTLPCTYKKKNESCTFLSERARTFYEWRLKGADNVAYGRPGRQ